MDRRRTESSSSMFLLTFPLFPLAFCNIHAYIDPGTGSLVIQILIAGAMGALFLVKTYWTKIKGFFANLFSRFRRPND